MTIPKELEEALTKCQYCLETLNPNIRVEYRPEPNYGLRFCSFYCCDSYIKNIEGK